MTVSVLAPAKINLGLEVIRKRNDGFHDIATVFQTVSVFDRLHSPWRTTTPFESSIGSSKSKQT